jgi:hypothetical protein
LRQIMVLEFLSPGFVAGGVCRAFCR